jgi:HD-GYP domain-containing protein (c-di-GMP phosphodiesterase class II)
MTAEDAMAELDRMAGAQFDPDCVAALRGSTTVAQAA